jgi:hypothetical protein
VPDNQDKPGHVITIPESLGRDVDKAREGRLKGQLPVEAFMSDAALAQVEAQSRAAATPVHAEQLIPISAAEGRRRRTFSGEGLPDFPQARRVIPPPFRRPSISAGRHGKTWGFIEAQSILNDDLIIGIGLVVAVEEKVVYATKAELGISLPGVDEDFEERVAIGIAIVVTGKGGEVRAFRERDQVKVFRRHEAKE